jgi:LPXTG-motif cell wall-anchored protein
VKAQGAPTQADLAQTGSSPVAPYLAGGAVALLLAGGGAVALARRRG